MTLVSQNMLFWRLVVMLLALLGSAYAEDTVVSLVDDSGRVGKTYSSASDLAYPSANTDAISISYDDSLIVSGLSKIGNELTSVSWEVLEVVDTDGSSEVCAYHGSTCYSRDYCEASYQGTQCTGSACGEDLFGQEGKKGCKKLYDIFETNGGWAGDSNSNLKITCTDSEGCEFLVFVRLYLTPMPPPPLPPSPPPSPPPGAGEYQSSDTKSCTQEWNHLKCDSKVTMTNCVATTDCVWNDNGDEYCYYSAYDALSQAYFDQHYADRDYTSRDDIEAMPLIALCTSKSFQACTGDCLWRMNEANDYDTDGIYEREGQCYPKWPLVKAELESNGAPAGTVGHWSYLSYSLQYCVAETETACQDIAGCVWGGDSNGCHQSFAVRAKSLDEECPDFDGLGFDQFYDASTPSLSDSTDASTPSLSDSTSGACAVFNTVCAIVVVFTSVILQVLR